MVSSAGHAHTKAGRNPPLCHRSKQVLGAQRKHRRRHHKHVGHCIYQLAFPADRVFYGQLGSERGFRLVGGVGCVKWVMLLPFLQQRERRAASKQKLSGTDRNSSEAREQPAGESCYKPLKLRHANETEKKRGHAGHKLRKKKSPSFGHDSRF